MKKEIANCTVLMLLFLLNALPICAQKEKETLTVLDQITATFKKEGGKQIDFLLKTTNAQDNEDHYITGKIEMKGQQFLLTTSQVITWFDGKTQWSYLISSDEVSIATPTDEELQTINPYYLLAIYKNGYNYRSLGEKKINGLLIQEIELTPENAQSTYLKIILRTVKGSKQPHSIELFHKDKTKSLITVTKYQTKKQFADTLFKFNKKSYPTAELIDLR